MANVLLVMIPSILCTFPANTSVVDLISVVVVPMMVILVVVPMIIILVVVPMMVILVVVLMMVYWLWY